MYKKGLLGVVPEEGPLHRRCNGPVLELVSGVLELVPRKVVNHTLEHICQAHLQGKLRRDLMEAFFEIGKTYSL